VRERGFFTDPLEANPDRSYLGDYIEEIAIARPAR